MAHVSDLPDRVGLQQRVLPAYRGPFCAALAKELPGSLEVFAGRPRAGEGIPDSGSLHGIVRMVPTNLRLGWGGQFLLWQLGWQSWLRAFDPQLLVVEANPRYLSNHFAARWMRSRRRPVVGWSLGPVGQAKGEGVLAARLRCYYAAFDSLVVYSRQAVREFDQIGIPREKVHLAPNAVQSSTSEAIRSQLASDHSLVRHWREQLGLGEGLTVLFVGRLQTRKRVDQLLRASSRVQPCPQLLVVGDGPERKALEELASRLLPACKFLGDLRGEELGRCFAAADLLALPGTGGLAVQEAMLYGKPVAVAQADGSQLDLVRPGRNGWLLPASDENALTEVLNQASADPDRLQAMGAASLEIVQETATLEKMVAGFLSAIRWAWGHRFEESGRVPRARS
ncbi:MAG: glycosyltransferase family 4 protein [Anaerolineales bacterium]|jgi:glycosyltransferase involved in cell wall biosynthesis